MTSVVSGDGDVAGAAAAVGERSDAVLAWTRELLEPALRATVATLPPRIRQVGAFHHGWVDERGEPVSGTPGKLVRPALVLGCAVAAGGDPAAAVAVPAAVAVELVHNASLIHDDIVDGDATRRGRPAVWSAFGTPKAILAGDALFILAVRAATRLPAPMVEPAVVRLTDTIQILIDGEQADLDFESRTTLTTAECLAMAAGKTGALLECACALGAQAAGADGARVRAYGRFGAHLGLAFQLADDLLGLWGDPALTGKPTGSDVRARKKTLPVVAALNSGTPAAAELTVLYENTGAPLDTATSERVLDLVEQAGGRAWAQARAFRELQRALHYLHVARPLPGAEKDLTAIAELVVCRGH
jgi:geranylgeranyl diphosphate synthase type I